MAHKRKSWAEKMKPDACYKVKQTTKRFADIPEGSKMLIPTPTIVQDYLKQIPEGVSTSLQQMRKDLAAIYNADYTCPVTAGIFLRIVAENAWEELQQGKSPNALAPFWRMLEPNSPTAKKLSFGTDFLQQQRTIEGLS